MEKSSQDPSVTGDEGTVGFFPEKVTESRKKPKTFKVPTLNWKDFLTGASERVERGEEEEEEEESNSSEPSDQEDIATVRKSNVFSEEITEEEQKIIDARISQQRKKFKDLERLQFKNQVKQVKMIHPWATREEAMEALQLSKNDEADACSMLTDLFNLSNVRKNIALRHAPAVGEVERDRKGDESEGEDLSHLYRKRSNKNLIKKSRSNAQDKAGREHFPKMRLDTALKQKNFEGWSVARKKAWDLRGTNPNAYYYRFNDPGEEQRSGAWTKAEMELFNKRMAEVGVDGRWGVFAMTIPGRVGYQCSNFYRHLIVTKQLKDDNYVVDEKGKIHFLFKGKPRKRKGDGDEKGEPSYLKKKKKGKKSKKKGEEEDEEDEMDSDDDEYVPKSKTKEEFYDPVKANPLPNFVDQITLEEVVKPAISPNGHVLSYDTWIDCFKNTGGTCPITKQPMKPRDLTILTWDNIDEFRDKIKE
eukprot:TRINITY_DN4062_c0_g1_i1.p1 TRINITY_DN4062_c0_g1~~TRINITY_DN4062_c0_g1_i1.p1  ORF type:complete len:474 (-),score=194.20 TRINITY_DN4062_c0_g1_i1:27-1448(-)